MSGSPYTLPILETPTVLRRPNVHPPRPTLALLPEALFADMVTKFLPLQSARAVATTDTTNRRIMRRAIEDIEAMEAKLSKNADLVMLQIWLKSLDIVHGRHYHRMFAMDNHETKERAYFDVYGDRDYVTYISGAGKSAKRDKKVKLSSKRATRSLLVSLNKKGYQLLPYSFRVENGSIRFEGVQEGGTSERRHINKLARIAAYPHIRR
jgi:hypothetical protein